MSILQRSSAAVATPERIVSPTDFHNSVHNAAAGYWGIGTGSRAPSTTLAGYDESFALGLLEAGLQVVGDRRAVLLVVFDEIGNASCREIVCTYVEISVYAVPFKKINYNRYKSYKYIYQANDL